jgi:outer membrane beta-barrel protein
MKLGQAVLLFALFAAPAFGQSSEQEAGDVSEVDKDRLGPLRERIRPVSGQLFIKKGRFEFSPSATISVRDSFFTKYIVGGAITYHPLETFGVSLRLGYSIPVVSGNAQICTVDPTTLARTCRSPTFSQIDGRAPGQINLLAGLDLQWAPIYGKFSLFSEKFVHFDLYGIAGPAAVRYAGPDGNGGSAQKTAIGGNAGLGARFFFNPWMTLRMEVRDLIYNEQVLPMGSTSLRQQLLFELGLSFFFPTRFSES